MNVYSCRVATFGQKDITVLDVMEGTTVSSARQEFLGCVFDLKQRIAALSATTDQAFKQVVNQICEEYQVCS